MMNKIERRRIIQDADVIKVREECEIDIDDDNLSAPENLPVVDQQVVSHSISKDGFGHNGF